jgi:hypothetical protein
MNRPRIAGIVSGIAASVAAFLVVHRWALAGTLTGAAIMPVVYTLVSHCSMEGLSGLGRWVRRRVGREVAAEADGGGTTANVAPKLPEKPRSEAAPPRIPRGRPWRQWALVSVSVAALGVSICSVALRAPVEQVLVRERVVEKTVTVTTEAAGSDVAESGIDNGSPTTTVTTDQGDSATTTTTATGQDGTGQEGSAGQDGIGGSSSSTTVSGSSSTDDTVSPPTTQAGPQSTTP